jgi:plasmid stabilization system protein ParE
MARLEWSHEARNSLDRMIQTHSLPADTRARVEHSLRHLRRFPLMGSPIGGRAGGTRFLLGPWRWMIAVYAYLEDEDRVVVVAVEDGRSSTASGRHLR